MEISLENLYVDIGAQRLDNRNLVLAITFSAGWSQTN